MAVIVEFKPSKTRSQSVRMHDRPDMGMIVFFTGVRYERMPARAETIAVTGNFAKKNVRKVASARNDARS